MAPKKKNKKKKSSSRPKDMETCPSCGKECQSLAMHYSKSNLRCAERAHDASIVGIVRKKHNNNSQFSNVKNVDNWTIDNFLLMQTNDQDAGFFEIDNDDTNDSQKNECDYVCDDTHHNLKSIPFTSQSVGAMYLSSQFQQYEKDVSCGINFMLESTNEIIKVFEDHKHIFENYSKQEFQNNFNSMASEYRSRYNMKNMSTRKKRAVQEEIQRVNKRLLTEIVDLHHSEDFSLPKQHGISLSDPLSAVEYNSSDDDELNNLYEDEDEDISNDENKDEDMFNDENEIVSVLFDNNGMNDPLLNVNEDHQRRTLPFDLIYEGIGMDVPNLNIGMEFSHKYDFRDIQCSLLRQISQQFEVDQETVACIKLLKLMQIGRIPQCHYSDLITWYEETSLLLNAPTASSNNQYLSSYLSRSPSLNKKKDSIVTEIDKLLSNNDSKFSLKPIHKVIELPSTKKVKISTYKLPAVILSLLTDPEFLTKKENNHFNNIFYRQPAKQFEIPIGDRVYSDIHHGYSFHQAHRKHCNGPRDVLVPIIAFIDGTPIDAYGRLKLEVVMISLGIATQKFRNKSKAWRILGYIPTESTEEDKNTDPNPKKKKQQKHDQSTMDRDDYHFMLSSILEELLALEKSDGILWDILDDEGNIETVRLKFVLYLISGDAVGHDKLCDRYISYGKKVITLCRDCDCPSDKLNDHRHICRLTQRKDITSKESNELKKMSYYKVRHNAFDKGHFSYCSSGINGNSPWEFLHQFYTGVQTTMNGYFFDCLTKPGSDMCKQVCRYLAINCQRQSARNYFDIQIFKDGLEKPQLTGSEIMSQTFMIYLCLVQSVTLTNLCSIERESKERYKTKTRKSSGAVDQLDEPVNVDEIFDDSDVDDNVEVRKVEVTKLFYAKVGKSLDHLKKWIKLFEYSLCLDAWLTQSEIKFTDLDRVLDEDNNEGFSPADIAIRDYLKFYVDQIQIPIGNGTLTSKIHALLHIAHYARKFGPSSVFSTQRPESNLSIMVKGQARLTQLRPSLLIEQSTERYYESVMIERAYDILDFQGHIPKSSRMQQKVEDKDDQPPFVRNIEAPTNNVLYISIGKYQLRLKDDKTFDKVVWPKKRHKTISHNKDFINQVIQRLRCDDYQLQSNHIDCFTRLTIANIGNGSRYIFRADPYFFQKIWMDWCIISWKEGNTDVEKRNLGRLLMFIDPSKMKFGVPVLDEDDLWAVVRCTEEDNRPRNKIPQLGCRLVSCHRPEDTLRIVSCKSIVDTAFVVTDVNKIHNLRLAARSSFISEYVLLLKDRKDWAELFIDGRWND